MMQGKVDMSFKVRGSKGELLLDSLSSSERWMPTDSRTCRLWKDLLYFDSKGSVETI